MSSEILDTQIALQVEDKYLIRVADKNGEREVLELYIRNGEYYTRPAFCPAAKIPKGVGDELVKRYGLTLGTEERVFEITTRTTLDNFVQKYWHRDRTIDEIRYGLAVPLEAYIKDEFGGSQRAFADAQGVAPAQVTQWLKKDFIVVNDELYSHRRTLSRSS